MKRSLSLLAAAWLVSSLAQAQVQLPSAPGAEPSPAGAQPARTADAKAKARAPARKPGSDSLIGKALRLNGSSGDLEFAKGDKGKGLRIVKLTLAGEVISDPAQKCEISIVADSPIETKSEGSPEGLPRYAADIPACPLTFDVLSQSVLTPSQTTACVFKAADCQASPSGLWGPDGASLASESKEISHERAHAEAVIESSLKTLEKHEKAVAADLEKEQNDFAAQRDEICRDYADEAQHGFCDARMTEARAALLHKRAAKLKSDSEE